MILKFLHILKKEFMLVFRDVHFMVVLFILPAIFIIIMSFAMENALGNKDQPNISIAILNHSQNQVVANLITDLKRTEAISVRLLRTGQTRDTLKQELIKNGSAQFALVFDQEQRTDRTNKLQIPPFSIFVDPSVSRQTLTIFRQTLLLLMLKNKMLVLEKQLPDFTKSVFVDMQTTLPEPEYLYQKDTRSSSPTPAQQNVPAWLVFFMFFICMPLSNIFINEKAGGTSARLKSMNVPYAALLAGKVIPYFIINQAQMLLMLLVGIYLMPILGGTSLQVTGSWTGLLLISASVSIAAISFALFIGSRSRTTEEANLLGAGSSIIMGALGGIMVPRFIMPPFMRSISALSPMSWGLEGFLDILLRGGNARQVLPECVLLLFFGLICLTLTILKNRRELD